MVSTASAKRILIPADRSPSRERLMATLPFFLRDLAAVPPDAPPRILAFESDSFLDDFLAFAAAKRTLAPLLPWRDWAEPPAGLLDAFGAVRYPATLTRRNMAAFATEIEPASGPVMDADGIPRGLTDRDASAPPWLRKLYLPLHERFNIISFDAVCGAAGWPRVARSRVKGSGAVIRRLVADTTGERWEDWIAADEKHGAWLELLPADLHVMANAVDPAKLPAPSAAIEARLRTLLNVAAGAPLPNLALASTPLALLPPDAGAAAEHCTLYGYLPVFSSAREVPTQSLTGANAAAIASALAQQAGQRLDKVFLSATDLRNAAHDPLRRILDATILPSRPSTAQQTAASVFIGTLSGGAPAGLGGVAGILGQSIDLALSEALARLWQTVTATTTADLDIAGTVRNGDGLWAASAAGSSATAAGIFDGFPDPNPSLPGNQTVQWLTAGSGAGQWDTLLRERLHALMDAWLAGNALPAPAIGGTGLITEDHLAVVVLMAFLRVRGCRLAMAANINRALFGTDKAGELKTVGLDGRFELGLAALAETIEAVLAQEAARGDITATPPWPPVAMPAAWIRNVHDDGQTLATLYGHFDDGLAAAGSAAVDELAAQVANVETRLDTAIGSLRAGLGFDAAHLRVAETPLSGLLALPGFRINNAALTAFRNAAQARYTAQPERLALPEARAADTLPRLRFDADHIFAAWGWVRIAGRSPCEPERIVWTQRSEPFTIADPTDLLGARPAHIQMPDIPKLLRDIPRLARARAKPFAGMAAPAGSGTITGSEMADTRRDFGIGMICNFGIPILTICAQILFKIIFMILITLPSFSWMLFLKICLPFPKRGP